MYPPSFPARPAHGGLPVHLQRLGQVLAALAERLRESLADAVGRTAADALREAVQAALRGPDCPQQPRLTSSPTGRPGPAPRYFERDEPSWRSQSGTLARRERFYQDEFDPDDPYERDFYDDEPDPDELPARQEVADPRLRRQALAAGLQAAAWFWARHAGRAALPAALAVGLAAGLLTLSDGGQLGAAALVASGLSLLYLADLVRWLGTLLASA